MYIKKKSLLDKHTFGQYDVTYLNVKVMKHIGPKWTGCVMGFRMYLIWYQSLTPLIQCKSGMNLCKDTRSSHQKVDMMPIE